MKDAEAAGLPLLRFHAPRCTVVVMHLALIAFAALVAAAAPLAAQKTDSTRVMRADIMAAIMGPNATRITDAGWSRHVSKFRIVGDTAWVTVEQVWRMGPRDTSSVTAEDELHYYGNGRPRSGGYTDRREYRVERRDGQWVMQ